MWWHTTWDTLQTKAFAHLDTWDILPQNRQAMDDLFGRGHQAKITPHASNRYAAEAVIRHGLLTLLKHRIKHRRAYYFVTIVDRRWNTYDRQPILNFPAMQHSVDLALSERGLNGFGICELQFINNERDKEGGRGYLITPHIHMIAWSAGGPINPDALERYLSGKFEGNFGAKSVDVEPVRDTAIDLASAFTYMTKAPYCAKYVQRVKDGLVLKETVNEGYRPAKCLRILELLSHHTIEEMSFACGREGAKLRAKVFKRVRDEEEGQRQHRLGDFSDPTKLWATERRRNRKDAYQPPVIVRQL